MQSNGVRHRRNAHDLYLATVCYRYHPLYGVEVTVIRYLRRISTAPIVIVRCPDGLQMAIPEWMLSPAACDRLLDEVRPHIALSALFALRRLLSEHAPATERCSRAKSSRGGEHARQRQAANTTVAASVPPGPDLDSITRERSNKLPGSARPVARGDVQATRAEGQ